MMKKYKLYVVGRNGKQSIQYVTASSPLQAKQKYYGGAHHFRTESTIDRINSKVSSNKRKPTKRRVRRSSIFTPTVNWGYKL